MSDFLEFWEIPTYLCPIYYISPKNRTSFMDVPLQVTNFQKVPFVYNLSKNSNKNSTWQYCCVEEWNFFFFLNKKKRIVVVLPWMNILMTLLRIPYSAESAVQSLVLPIRPKYSILNSHQSSCAIYKCFELFAVLFAYQTS